MDPVFWQAEFGDEPLVACAIHAGHEVRPEVADCLQIDSVRRLYEEDPYTGDWTTIAANRIVGRRSRFEVDLNRPREKAVYLTPDEAWGLEIWNCPPEPHLVERSLALYDDFYAHLRLLLERLVARYGRVVVFDLHSYNYVRGGPGGEPADPRLNPEVNLGTGTMERTYWAPIVERWLDAMRQHSYLGRSLDVRENVRFFGGHLPGWIHQHFPETICALAIEVKKFFMDEWTGELDRRQHEAIRQALASGAAAVTSELERLSA